jgi:hypothetical protein
MTVDITVTRDPPKERCRLCGLTLYGRFGEMFLVLYDTPEQVVTKHQGIKICQYCHEKLLIESGMTV